MATKSAASEAKANGNSSSVKALLDRLMAKANPQEVQQQPAPEQGGMADVLKFITQTLHPDAWQPIAHLLQPQQDQQLQGQIPPGTAQALGAVLGQPAEPTPPPDNAATFAVPGAQAPEQSKWGGAYDYMPNGAPLKPLGSYSQSIAPGTTPTYGTNYSDNYQSYLQENQVPDSIGARLRFGSDVGPTEPLPNTRSI